MIERISVLLAMPAPLLIVFSTFALAQESASPAMEITDKAAQATDANRAEPNVIQANNPKAWSADSALEEIIVIASRREIPLREFVGGIDVIRPSEFTAVGLDRLGDALEYTPGVDIIEGDRWGTGTLFMRAVTQEEYTPVTVVYVDDVPLTDSTPNAWGSTLFMDGLLADLERIEVVKGPQGTLYGTNALGGVIRYVTRDPSLTDVRGTASIDLAAISHGGTKQQYRANVSGPLVGDVFGIGVSVLYSDRSGYLDQVDSDSAVLAEDVNSYEVKALTATGLWKISDNASAKFRVLEFASPYEYSGIEVPFDWDTYKPTYGRYATDAPPSPGEYRYDSYSVTVKYDFPWAELTSVTARVKYDERFSWDITRQFGSLVDELTGSPLGTNTVPFQLSLFSERLVQEIRLTATDNRTFDWLVGGFYTDLETDNVQSGTAEPSGFNLFGIAFPSTYREEALFGDITWNLSDRLDITVGARYTSYKTSLDDYLSGFFFGLSPGEEQQQSASSKDSLWTYMLGARWRPSARASLYMRAANGFRPAAGSVPVIDPDTGENLAPIIKSDDLWSYEVGVRGDLFSGHVQYDVALWHMKWKDFQASRTVNGISVGGNSSSDITGSGFEASLIARPTANWEIEAAVAGNDSSLDKDAPDIGGSKGESLRRLPSWTGSIRAFYEFGLADLDVRAGGGMRYVGGYDTAYKGGEPGCGCDLNFPVESYTLVDLSAEFRKGRFSVSVYARNALDRYALANANAVDIFGSPFVTGNPAQPREIGAILSVDF